MPSALTGYAAARALHQRRLAEGWKPLGRKIGFTNRSIWPRYGVYEPIWGTVYDRTLIRVRENRAAVTLAGIPHPRIEPEICFKLAAAPPRTSDPEQLLAAIEWVAHAVEIVQCDDPAWKVTLESSTAQNGLHARLIVGTSIAVSRGMARLLPAVEVVLRKDGVEVDRGTGANALDSPLLALAHFIAVLAAQPESPPLAAGEIVTTGTLTDAHPVAPGETWRTEISGLPLGDLELSFR